MFLAKFVVYLRRTFAVGEPDHFGYPEIGSRVVGGEVTFCCRLSVGGEALPTVHGPRPLLEFEIPIVGLEGCRVAGLKRQAPITERR